MTEYVKLYLGSSSDMKGSNEEFFHRSSLVSVEATEAPADIPRHYDIQATVKSKQDGNKYVVNIDSRRVNNWLDRFDSILKEELKSEDGLDGKYVGNQRNPKILELLSELVPMWINTRKASKL